ncbi:MAG: glycosyltransferase family protein [Candidatus Methanoperedens sp.]
MNICFYISDYGYGHASRSIAIIRKLLSEYKDVKIYIKNSGAFDYIRSSLPHDNIEVVKSDNDIGVIFRENSISVDKEQTRGMLIEWIKSWDEYIKIEKQFCESRRIDLILSDITPQAFIVANELGIPGIAISNFSWHYIFFNLFGNIPVVEQIKGAYMLADLALVLPFNEGLDAIKKQKKVGLVSREITMEKYDLRRSMGISDNELLVYMGVGMSIDPSFMSNIKKLDIPDLKLLVQHNVCLPFKNVVRIPDRETETQNYINMCDLVVSKTGYSTASEAIRAKIPIFFIKRDGFKEDELVGDAIEKMGVGRFISERSFLECEWRHELGNLDKYILNFDNMDDRFRSDGTEEIIGEIRKYYKEWYLL